MKKQYVFLTLAMAVVMVMSACSHSKKAAQHYPKVDVSAYFIYDNEPRYGVHIYALNYETALRKIKSGKFAPNDFSHFTFETVKKDYQVSHDQVAMGQYRFGNNIQNSQADAEKIVTLLFQHNKSYLTYVNGLKSEVLLKNPNNTHYKFTNKKGRAVGHVEKGFTIFQDTAIRKSFKALNVKDGATVYLGNTIKDQAPVLLEQQEENISKEYGQEVTYQIPIQSDQIVVRVSPNFVVDKTNLPYTKVVEPKLRTTIQDGEIVAVKNSPTLIDGHIQLTADQSGASAIEQKKLSKDLTTYATKLGSIDKLTFSNIDQSVRTLEIKGHVSGRVNYQLPVIIESDNGEMTPKTQNLDVYSAYSKQGLFIEDAKGYRITPQVESYGINFVTHDDSNNPVSGPSFLVGKIHKKKVYLLATSSKGQGQWVNTNLNVKQFMQAPHSQKALAFQSNRTTYTDGQTKTIPINDRIWAYDAKDQTKANKALYKLRGFSNQQQYFLWPVHKNTSVNQGKPIYFQVNDDSIAKAQETNYRVNGSIVDMAYGSEEYNAILITQKQTKPKKQISPVTLIIIFVGAVSLFYLVLIYYIIKK
ncbi:hypothetical protein [Streptococcus halichoeri]|uniref:hypothetical protein n=1 Tax=Streptococcus halichoeri TaxID=254785 RepID=UPI001357F893|nr:hypothetical protein [Streptococcus halichoeri]